jgi:hypothetical protein
MYKALSFELTQEREYQLDEAKPVNSTSGFCARDSEDSGLLFNHGQGNKTKSH